MSSRREFLKGIGAGVAALSVPRVVKASKAYTVAHTPWIEPRCQWCGQPKHSVRNLSGLAWRDVEHGYCGDSYWSTAFGRFRHRGKYWEGTLPCPSCIGIKEDFFKKIGATKHTIACQKALSTVLNTVPGLDEFLYYKSMCMCGHPWLKTATEDYELFRNGETDVERQARRQYPTVSEWLNRKIKTTKPSGPPVTLLSNHPADIHPPFTGSYQV